MKKPSNNDLLATPLGFTKGILRLPIYQWQEQVLHDLDKPGAIALKAANGSGKTVRVAGPAALWHASVFPRSLAIVTSAVHRQIKAQLFPALHQHAHKFQNAKFNDTEIELHNGSKIIGVTADADPGRFEGFHNDNLLIIADEAKSIGDRIFEAIARCQPKRLLLLSSPGACFGEFYEAFHARRRFYRSHSVTAYDCPHIDPKWIEETIAKNGLTHPLVRTAIFAEFSSEADGGVIPLSFVERLLSDPPEFIDSESVHAFCDFSAGGDESVFALRRGNRVEIVAAWRERDTMQVIGRFIQLFREHGLRGDQISADEGGLGKPMCDRLAEEKWHVRRVNNGSEPTLKHYANRGAEAWYEGRLKIEKREIILPNDPELIGQMTSRLGSVTSEGKLRLESKEDMRRRGLPSPDRADAVLGAMECNSYSHISSVPFVARDVWNRESRHHWRHREFNGL